MDLKGVLSISGYPGLFKLVAHAKAGIIVESLIDKKRMQAFATSKISSLEDISVYTEGGDIPLVEVFKNIYKKENGGATIDQKSSPDLLKKYFEEILPEYDKERVYVSDIKRVVSWYNLLHGLNMIDLEEKKEEIAEEKTSE